MRANSQTRKPCPLMSSKLIRYTIKPNKRERSINFLQHHIGSQQAERAHPRRRQVACYFDCLICMIELQKSRLEPRSSLGEKAKLQTDDSWYWQILISYLFIMPALIAVMSILRPTIKGEWLDDEQIVTYFQVPVLVANWIITWCALASLSIVVSMANHILVIWSTCRSTALCCATIGSIAADYIATTAVVSPSTYTWGLLRHKSCKVRIWFHFCNLS